MHRSWFLNTILQLKEPGVLGEMTGSKAEASKHKMSLGHLVVTENEKEQRERESERERLREQERT